jgi:hypothetical protein
MRLVGLLVSESAQSFAGSLASVHQGLGAEGYVEGRNVAMSTVMPTCSTIGCQRWRPIWSSAGSR